MKGIKTGGRKKGTPNKRTMHFLETLKKFDFDPAEALVTLYKDALYGIEHGNRQERMGYIKIASDIAAELASYSYPKPKPLEVSDGSDTDKAEQAKELLELPDDKLLSAMKERLKLMSGKDV